MTFRSDYTNSSATWDEHPNAHNALAASIDELTELTAGGSIPDGGEEGNWLRLDEQPDPQPEWRGGREVPLGGPPNTVMTLTQKFPARWYWEIPEESEAPPRLINSRFHTSFEEPRDSWGDNGDLWFELTPPVEA